MPLFAMVHCHMGTILSRNYGYPMATDAPSSSDHLGVGNGEPGREVDAILWFLRFQIQTIDFEEFGQA